MITFTPCMRAHDSYERNTCQVASRSATTNAVNSEHKHSELRLAVTRPVVRYWFSNHLLGVVVSETLLCHVIFGFILHGRG